MKNKTKIFKSYADFADREDKKVNGVSEQFAKDYPNYEADNLTNEGCWNCSSCSDCSDCSSCSSCSDCSDCSYCSSCSSCSDCSDCSYCSYCSYCSSCSDCSDCSSCSDCRLKDGEKNDKKESEIKKIFETKIENIHQTVFEAASKPCALDMGKWHKDEKIQDGTHCGTTHCRAGHVIALAGKEGYQLEKFYGSTLVAAMRIYDNSSIISVPCTMFFENNKSALLDMEKCAVAERELFNG